MVSATPRSHPSSFDAQQSSYHAVHDNRLVRVDGQPVAPLADRVHTAFRAHVLAPDFSCLGARAALRGGAYRFGVYSTIGSVRATAGLAHDLLRFLEEQPAMASDFTTFVACFSGPVGGDDAQFEARLWRQLQRLHDLDQHDWDPTVSADPADPTFSYSFGGHAFFVVGLHDTSSRRARRFRWPTLVFNAHAQFERLRADGRYARMQQVIRQREMALQGSLNPNLGAFGERSEARQYAGRPVDADWRCPFHPAP